MLWVCQNEHVYLVLKVFAVLGFLAAILICGLLVAQLLFYIVRR
jgi:hypothetical protein